jgi:hypothetical protein
MNIPSYYIEGLLTQGTAALARTYLGVIGGGVPEAPVNGQSFARQNATWVVVPPPGISDAPINGTLYGRLNAAWSAVPALGFTPEDVANKSTGTALGTSNTSYPSQNAVKVYVDTATNGLDSPAYAASLPLDFLGKPIVTVTLAGNIQFTTTNRTAAYTVTVRIVCDASNRTFTWPAGWSWLSITPPAGISASKVAVLSITAFGTNNADVVAAYAVTP